MEQPLFQQAIQPYLGPAGLRSQTLEVIQLNLGLYCNLECRHCHLGASPRRQEMMSWSTMEQVMALVHRSGCRMVDLTGGAPELNPALRRLIIALRQSEVRVQLRTNLVVLLEPELAGLAEFLRDQQVALVASMPCYLEPTVTAQRGAGVYQQAITVLQQLNRLGYGVEPELPLNLVYNPSTAQLPPQQLALEAAYRRALQESFGIVFSRLLTIANMPIGRFRAELRRTRQEADYLTRLQQAFNPATLDHLMCRSQISVDWDGRLYDCDFNLALAMPIAVAQTETVSQADPARLAERPIVTGNHCLVCTAGCGSSCGGALAA
ncbi:MAG: arsenosugar biosynthesis radical SAM protein ArsS [Magnetococcales bacterium]|nr:arsenosugar biosynthesis radical SAM protein ArsS [Magnetococcales bacterium]